MVTREPSLAMPQANSNISNNQSSVNSQSTTASADQLKFVFGLVCWFFWGVVLLHFFPLWFFFQNIGPIKKRWEVINSMQVLPKLYEDLEKVYACDELATKIEPKTIPLTEDKIEEKTQPKIKEGRSSR